MSRVLGEPIFKRTPLPQQGFVGRLDRRFASLCRDVTREQALVDHIGSLEREIGQLSANPALLEFIENQGTPPRRARTVRRTGS